MVAGLAVGQVKKVLAILLLDRQTLGERDIGLQGGELGGVVQNHLHLLGLAGGYGEIRYIKTVLCDGCQCRHYAHQGQY